MARLSIYVNEQLHRRMKAAAADTNWSSIAAQAFEVELNRQTKQDPP